MISFSFQYRPASLSHIRATADLLLGEDYLDRVRVIGVGDRVALRGRRAINVTLDFCI